MAILKKPIFSPASGRQGDSFIGIRIIDNEIVFKYPATYHFVTGDEKEERRQVLEIMQTLDLTKKSISEDTLNSKFGSSEQTPLMSFLWIVKDYLEYHQYVNREKRIVPNGKGIIDWKRTFGQTPLIQDMQAVYPTLYAIEPSQKNNLIVDIYKYCVSDAIKKIGWIFGLSLDDYLITRQSVFHKERYLSSLKIELGKTFDDIKRLRLSHMVNIITGLDEETVNSSDFVFGVDSYEYVYESMLKNMFSDIKNLEEFFPSADWYLVTDGLTKKSSNLRPDIVIRNDVSKKVYILDAKYYRFGITFSRGDLPDSSSIQKQITYAEYVKNLKLNGYQVFSCFVMPYDKLNNAMGYDDNIVYVGTATAPWKEEQNALIGNEVIAVLLDTTYLINHWKHLNQPAIDELCEIIEKRSTVA